MGEEERKKELRSRVGDFDTIGMSLGNSFCVSVSCGDAQRGLSLELKYSMM